MPNPQAAWERRIDETSTAPLSGVARGYTGHLRGRRHDDVGSNFGDASKAALAKAHEKPKSEPAKPVVEQPERVRQALRGFELGGTQPLARTFCKQTELFEAEGAAQQQAQGSTAPWAVDAGAPTRYQTTAQAASWHLQQHAR